MSTILCSDSVKGRDHPKDPLVHGRIILERIFGKQGGKVWTRFMRPRIGSSGVIGSSCKEGNGPSGSIKRGKGIS